MTPKEAVEHFTMHEVTIAPVNTIAIAADETSVTNYGRELFRTRRVNHAAFDAAWAQFGARGLADLTTLMDCYSMLACNINAKR